MRARHSAMALGMAMAVGVTVAASARPPESAQAAGTQTCIALVLPSVKGASDANDFAASLRDLLASYLSGPSLRTILLEARLPSQAIEEVKQKDCGYVLLTSIEQKRNDGGGWGRILGRAASGAAWYVPYGGSVGSAAARSAAVGGAQAVAAMAEGTKAKDEIILEFRIGPPASVLRASAKSEKAKAQSDGEDLLTPVVEKVAETIAVTVLKR